MFDLGSIDYGAIFGGGDTSAFGGPAGMNPQNMAASAGVPGPQNSPSLYQPNGMFYGSAQQPMPYNPMDIRSKLGQSMQAPDFAGALRSQPQNGTAHNSPARAYIAAMRTAGQVGQNANMRAMLPLQYAGQNANAMQGYQIGDQDYNLSLQGMSQSQSNQGMGMIFDLLSPFLNQMMSEAG